MKKGIIVILISFLAIGCNSTRSFINKADILIGNGQYGDALFYLKKSFDLKADEVTGRKIANTYFELRDFNQAEFWYKWIRSNSDFSVLDYYILAEILIGNSKYGEAKLVLEDLASFDENQTFILKWQNLVKVTFESSVLLNSGNNKQIQPFSNLNSPFSDFGYFAFNDKKYFLSNRVNDKLEKKGGNKNYEESIFNPFFKIYEFENDSLIQKKDPISIGRSTILENVYHLGPIFMNDSIFAYTYSSDELSKSKGNWKLSNPQVKIFQNNSEIQIDNLGLNNFFITDPFYSPIEKRIYFSANFADSFGGLDIYYIEKKDQNDWSNPINCGSSINSFGDERSPFWFDDTFYFSSNGRGGLGGFDIYKSDSGLEIMESPVNMGIPYNSSKDDLFYFIDRDSNNLEIFTSDREGGIGFDDIYYITDEDSYYLPEKVFRVVDFDTKKPLADTSIKFDSINVFATNSLGYSVISNLSENSLMTFSKDNYFSKTINNSLFNYSDSVDVELERIDLNKSFAYIGIDSLILSQTYNKQLDQFLENSIINLIGNPEYSLRFMIHSNLDSVNFYDSIVNIINKYLNKVGDYSDRVEFLYYSNYYPLFTKDIVPSYSQIELNSRIEFEIFEKNTKKDIYSIPNYYYHNSNFISLSNPELKNEKSVEAQEQFIFVSEFEDLKTNVPNFSIIVASLASLIEARNQQEIMEKKYPGHKFDIINPTLISMRYRVSVYSSPSKDEINNSINSYFKDLKMKGIWILEH